MLYILTTVNLIISWLIGKDVNYSMQLLCIIQEKFRIYICTVFSLEKATVDALQSFILHQINKIVFPLFSVVAADLQM